jgi:hypothetical protein
MKLYLAGPMSGIPQFNFPEFARVATKLRELGYEIINPAEQDSPAVQAAAIKSEHGDWADLPKDETWGSILAKDVIIIADPTLDGIIAIPGWERSKGARLEAFIALLTGKKHLLLWDKNDHVVPVGPDYFRYQLMRNMP